MTPIADMVVKMMTAGVDPAIIALAVETAETVIYASAIPQNSAESADDRRRRKDRERKAAKKENPQNSAEFHGNAESTLSLKNINKKEKKERKHATRLSAEFQPTPEMVSYSADLGMTQTEIDELGVNMREWSLTAPKGAKLDWGLTWQTWCRRFVKEHPRPASNLRPGHVGIPIKPGTPQFDAWWKANPENTLQRSLMVRAEDTGQPYYAKSEWPPDYSPVSKIVSESQRLELP